MQFSNDLLPLILLGDHHVAVNPLLLVKTDFKDEFVIEQVAFKKPAYYI